MNSVMYEMQCGHSLIKEQLIQKTINENGKRSRKYHCPFCEGKIIAYRTRLCKEEGCGKYAKKTGSGSVSVRCKECTDLLKKKTVRESNKKYYKRGQAPKPKLKISTMKGPDNTTCKKYDKCRNEFLTWVCEPCKACKQYSGIGK